MTKNKKPVEWETLRLIVRADSQHPDILADDHGKEGWELVSVVPIASRVDNYTEFFHLWFKRKRTS